VGKRDHRTRAGAAEREIERVGGSRTLRVDARVVAATNRDLLDAVRRGDFREDLFDRLNVYPIGIPPLRDRRDDVPLLVDLFLRRCCAPTNARRWA
jgi:transcriptional regulator with GAF, ATPase, and Fis domain